MMPSSQRCALLSAALLLQGAEHVCGFQSVAWTTSSSQVRPTGGLQSHALLVQDGVSSSSPMESSFLDQRDNHPQGLFQQQQPQQWTFQLEEMEEQFNSITELVLHAEHQRISIGRTDGPVPTDAHGTWEYLHDDNHEPYGSIGIHIVRTFGAGYKGTDMGAFDYQVKRVLVGTIGHVGEQTSVSGTIHDVDELLGDRNVGFFSMIDITGLDFDSLEKQGRVSAAF